MTASLFREEALRRFRRSPFQPPLLSKPVSGLLLAALSALAVVGMVLFAFSFQFARKEQATGYLSPVGGRSRVSVRHPAVVRQRFVEAGDVVEVGDELFELTTGEGFEDGQSVANRILRDIEGRRQALRERLAATERTYLGLDNQETTTELVVVFSLRYGRRGCMVGSDSATRATVPARSTSLDSPQAEVGYAFGLGKHEEGANWSTTTT